MGEKFHQTQLPLYYRIINYFRQYGKGHCVECVIINTGKKISPTTAGGEIGEIFLLVKFLALWYYIIAMCQFLDLMDFPKKLTLLYNRDLEKDHTNNSSS